MGKAVVTRNISRFQKVKIAPDIGLSQLLGSFVKKKF
jgi:hypothetical protein